MAFGHIRDPELMNPIPNWSPDSVREQVRIARNAQIGWATTPLRKRLAVVRRLRGLIAARGTRLAEMVSRHKNSSRAEILVSEVLPLADACRFLEREAEAILRPRSLGTRGRPLWLTGVRTEIRREPRGTVLVIGPGNYPLYLPGVQSLQALVAGNAVVLKPGEGGKDVATQFAQVCEEAGLGPGLVQVLPEATDTVALALEAGVDHVVLTGSADTGVAVLRSIAPYLVPATMELSGCDAAFVLPDADLKLTARAFRFGLTWNDGATCIAPRRAFVFREVQSALEASLLKTMGEVRRSETRWRLDLRTESLARDAITRGARPLVGLGTGDERETLPTILGDVRPDMPLLSSDVFSPILSLVSVASEGEALAVAGQCPFALGSTIFGEERSARRMSSRIRAGVVIINDVIVPTADPRVPFGGRGRSGFGVTRGAEGLRQMTVLKVVAVRRGACRHLDEPDFTDQDLAHAYLMAAHGATWMERWRARLSLPGQLIRKALAGAAPKEVSK